MGNGECALTSRTLTDPVNRFCSFIFESICSYFSLVMVSGFPWRGGAPKSSCAGNYKSARQGDDVPTNSSRELRLLNVRRHSYEDELSMGWRFTSEIDLFVGAGVGGNWDQSAKDPVFLDNFVEQYRLPQQFRLPTL